jgi:hypothetical protein
MSMLTRASFERLAVDTGITVAHWNQCDAQLFTDGVVLACQINPAFNLGRFNDAVATQANKTRGGN